MAVDTKTALHLCRVIGRQITSCYPTLTLSFVVHTEGKRAAGISSESINIQEHPAGETMMNFIENNEASCKDENLSKFIGLAEHKSPGFLGFFRSTDTLALFYVNSDRFKTEHELKNQVIHMVWHALALHEDYEKQRTNEEEEETEENRKKYIIKDDVILPDLSLQEFYHRNLLADIFSASLQNIQGHREAIRSLAEQRMLDTLAPQVGFVSEKYPFPISLETLDFLFSDSLKTVNKKMKTVPQAVKITKEIGMTYQLSAIKQWRAFCMPAQEMAWCGYAPETILGAAIYTNENTYVRSIADMVAEQMGIKPKMFSNLNDYNPFADNEMNERIHTKMIQENTSKSLKRIRQPADVKTLFHQIILQNNRILEGNPVGWAAYPFMVATMELKDDPNLANADSLAKAERIILHEAQKIPFSELRSTSRYIFRKRREGENIDKELLENIPEKTKNIENIKTALLMNEDLREKYPLQDETAGNISQYLNPNTIKQ